MASIWARYSPASMPRAGCGSDTSVIPERSAPKKVARQSWDAVSRAATVPAGPARSVEPCAGLPGVASELAPA